MFSQTKFGEIIMTLFFVGIGFLLLFSWFMVFKLPGLQEKFAKEDQEALARTDTKSNADLA
jgi:hypothetical protein